LQPMVLHRHVLAFDVAGFVEALAEPGNKGRIRQSGTDEADHRHRRLLRMHRERPRGCSAAEQRDELAPFQLIEGHSVPCQPGPNYRISNLQWSVRSEFTTCHPSARVTPREQSLTAAVQPSVGRSN